MKRDGLYGSYEIYQVRTGWMIKLWSYVQNDRTNIEAIAPFDFFPKTIDWERRDKFGRTDADLAIIWLKAQLAGDDVNRIFRIRKRGFLVQ